MRSMRSKGFLFLFTGALLLFFLLFTVTLPVDAYFAGNAFGVDPLNPGVDLDLDYLTRNATLYPGLGLYGLYGMGGLYGGLYGGFYSPLNILGYIYGVYGTDDIGSMILSPAGLSNSSLPGYGLTYHPLFGYYNPIGLFDNMFGLVNLFSWW